MRKIDRGNLMVVAAGIVLASLPGCIRLIGEVPRERADPLSAKAVRVSAVAGATCTLADGRRFELAGVDLGGLTTEQRTAFEQDARHRVEDPVVFVDDLGDGRARLVLSQSTLPRRNFESFYPFITLIPIWVDAYPRRVDLAAELVRDGRALPDLHGLGNVRALPNAGVGDRAKAPTPEIMPSVSYPDLLRQAGIEARRNYSGIYQRPPELLQAAVQQRDTARLSKLLAEGADVNAVSGGYTALGAACQYGYVDMVAFLLDRGASPTVPGISSPYNLGCAHQDVIAELLNRHVPLSAGETGTRVLMNSARYGDLHALELALKQGADPNGSIATWTPLMHAADAGQPAAVRLLLQYGADPARKNNEGQTALDKAKGSPEVQAILQGLPQGR